MPPSDSPTQHGNNALRHIAIIMDGNGRWAKKRLLPRFAGHKAGLDAVKKIVKACVNHQISQLSLFAFSSENWRRPEREVSLLMELFQLALKKEVKKLHKANVKLQVIGDRSRFSDAIQKSCQQAEILTQDNTALTLTIAANYGGRWDITQAARLIAKDVQTGKLELCDINEAHIEKYLQTKQIFEPDLFIRTGGEQRISNFMLWNLAYSEFYFTDKLWPDFDEAELLKAIDSFNNRQRRFGRTSEQIENAK